MNTSLLTMAFLIDSVGPGEVLVVMVVVLLLFGSKRLPEIARMMGRTAESLRRAYQDVTDEITREPPPDDPRAQLPDGPEPGTSTEWPDEDPPGAPPAPEEEKKAPHDAAR